MDTGYGRTAVENLAGHVVELLVELFEEGFDLGDGRRGGAAAGPSRHGGD